MAHIVNAPKGTGGALSPRSGPIYGVIDGSIVNIVLAASDRTHSLNGSSFIAQLQK